MEGLLVKGQQEFAPRILLEARVMDVGAGRYQRWRACQGDARSD